jgi:hypothetical protein
MSPSRRTLSPIFAEHVTEQRTNGTSGRRQSFARSRSPHIRTVNSSGQSPHQTTSTPMSHARHRALPTWALLPGEISLRVPIPFSGICWRFSSGARSLAESLLLLGSLFYANRKLALAFRLLDAPGRSVSSGKTSMIIDGLYAHLLYRNRHTPSCLHYLCHMDPLFFRQKGTYTPSVRCGRCLRSVSSHRVSGK